MNHYEPGNLPLYASIKEVNRITGLSQFFLRAGCRDGSLPCIKSGEKYLLNLPRLLELLDAKSTGKEV